MHLKILAVKDVDHPTTSRFARAPETFVIVKVEDVIRARTKPSRNERWADESQDIDVDRANEIEITVYDRTGDNPTPIGMMWIRLSDIVEEIRRKRIEQDISSTGWVSADNMESSTQMGYPPVPTLPAPPRANSGQTFAQSASTNPAGHEEPKPLYIDSWFVLEPVGQIRLQMSFGNYTSLLPLQPGPY